MKKSFVDPIFLCNPNLQIFDPSQQKCKLISLHELSGSTDNTNLACLTKELIAIYNSYSNQPHLKNKILNRIMRSIVNYCLAVNLIPKPSIDRQRKEYEEIVNLTYQYLAKQSFALESSFIFALYIEVLPVLLKSNQVTDKFLNSAGYNSRAQIISTIKTIIDVLQPDSEFRKFYIISPTCSHYNAQLNNVENSYDRGLLDEFYLPQVYDLLSPIKRIVSILMRYGIPVEVYIPQIDPWHDARQMLAMVPVAVWRYVSEERIVEMLVTTNKLSNKFHSLAEEYFSDLNKNAYKPCTLSDALIKEGSIIDLTYKYNNFFEQAYNVYLEITKRTRNMHVKWADLSTEEVQAFVDYLEFDDAYQELIQEIIREYQWTPQECEMFKQMVVSLATPEWGGLHDTQAFYARESIRRLDKHAENWRRVFNIDLEIRKLLDNSNFYPDLNVKERESEAIKLVTLVDALANIGIGGRAIFNTTVYFAFGTQLGYLSSNEIGAIMWPIQEATDRQALDAMNRGYKFIKGNIKDIIPLIVPEKAGLQPLGKREMKVNLHKYLKITKTKDKEWGVFTDVDILTGSLVIVGKPRGVCKQRTDMSFQVDKDSHVLLDDPAEKLNHSCDPNLGVRLNFYGGYNFYAKRDIRKGEELTWCYPTTEYISISVPNCLCSSHKCLKQIKGWEYLPEEMKQDFIKQKYVPQFILDLEALSNREL